MTIRYADGTVQEAILVRRSENRIRVAVRGGDDLLEFTQVNQVWVSEDCEPVKIEFNWQRHATPEDTLDEANFICSHELAAHLLHLLWTDSNEDVPVGQVAPATDTASATARPLMLN